MDEIEEAKARLRSLLAEQDGFYLEMGADIRTLLAHAETRLEALSTPAPDDPGQSSDGLCEDCGRRVPVWFAPNALWNRVKGGPEATDDPGGLLCPCCFIRRAETTGVAPTAWVLSPEAEAEAVVRSRHDEVSMVHEEHADDYSRLADKTQVNDDLLERLRTERSARLAAERERDEARVAWRSATETVGAASRVYETALDGRVETKRALRDAELRADAADAAGYRRGLEEAAALRDAFVSADYGEDWDRGLKQGMDDYQAAIRALPRGSSASQGER
jgi:hypothetical protein